MTRFVGEYAPDRKDIHNRVRADAGHRCIRCQHPEGDTPAVRMPCDEKCTHPQDGKQRVLTVHHLTGQKDDNRWWNLLALCQSCHLTIQGRVIPERPWLFEHTPWFVPYVCGFYAWYYGGIDITRAEAEATPDRWLAMGQPWRVPAADTQPENDQMRRSLDDMLDMADDLRKESRENPPTPADRSTPAPIACDEKVHRFQVDAKMCACGTVHRIPK